MVSFDKGSVACFEVPEGRLSKAQLLWFEKGPRV